MFALQDRHGQCMLKSTPQSVPQIPPHILYISLSVNYASMPWFLVEEGTCVCYVSMCSHVLHAGVTCLILPHAHTLTQCRHSTCLDADAMVAVCMLSAMVTVCMMGAIHGTIVHAQ